MFAAARIAWEAIRAEEPTALAELAEPFGDAFGRLLEELPGIMDGLSTGERHALRAVAAGARAPQSAFRAAQDLEAAPFMGDTWFYRVLTELGAGENRLLETEDGHELPRLRL